MRILHVALRMLGIRNDGIKNPGTLQSGVTMSVLHVLTALAIGATPTEAEVTPQQAIKSLSSEVQHGSLLFSQGDCLAVKIYTKSPYTHVAAVILRDGKPSVYDSTSGVGVRCLPLKEYLQTEQPGTIHVFHPKQPFVTDRVASIQSALVDRLGRPYAIRHHMTGKRAKGIHCSEYVTDALIAGNVLRANQPSRVSPASLLEGILKAELYVAGTSVHIAESAPEDPEDEGWCAWLWRETKQCTLASCNKLQGWFLCR